MDAGEFVAEVRPMMDDAGSVEGYMLYDSPLGGTSLNLVEDEAGNPTVVLGQGVVEYAFTPITP